MCSSDLVSSIFSDHNAMRLDINYRNKTVKNTNTWRLNNTLLNNQEITEEIKEEIKKYLETNDNENKTYGMQQAVLRGKFIAVQSYLKKQETSQINNLMEWNGISNSIIKYLLVYLRSLSSFFCLFHSFINLFIHSPNIYLLIYSTSTYNCLKYPLFSRFHPQLIGLLEMQIILGRILPLAQL